MICIPLTMCYFYAISMVSGIKELARRSASGLHVLPVYVFGIVPLIVFVRWASGRRAASREHCMNQGAHSLYLAALLTD